MGITLRQFEQLQNRARRPPASASAAVSPPKFPHAIVLGVDPSLRGTGYGVIALAKTGARLLDAGTVHCPANWERSRCLVRVVEKLRDTVRQHRPTACIIEGLFYAQNFQTALIMGEARGASLFAAAEAGLEIFELAPRRVKQAVVGYGGAQKFAVARMVQRMLNLAAMPEPDAADALALALAYAHSANRYSLQPMKRV